MLLDEVFAKFLVLLERDFVHVHVKRLEHDGDLRARFGRAAVMTHDHGAARHEGHFGPSGPSEFARASRATAYLAVVKVEKPAGSVLPSPTATRSSAGFSSVLRPVLWRSADFLSGRW